MDRVISECQSLFQGITKPSVSFGLVQDNITPSWTVVFLDKSQVYSALSNTGHDFHGLLQQVTSILRDLEPLCLFHKLLALGEEAQLGQGQVFWEHHPKKVFSFFSSLKKYLKATVCKGAPQCPSGKKLSSTSLVLGTLKDGSKGTPPALHLPGSLALTAKEQMPTHSLPTLPS